MLKELNLKNYAIIESLSLNFTKGLNIITGETGTGKSIIVDAVNIILGDRVNSDIIKSGTGEAVIEAVFDLQGRDDLIDLLKSFGIPESGDELYIRRIISRDGRSRAYINDAAATIKLLTKLTEELIDIFSQHEHQSLLIEKNHIKYLDLFMDNNELKDKYKQTYEEYKNVNNKYEKLMATLNHNKEKDDYLRFQLKELSSLKPQPDEDNSLSQEEKLLSNSENIAETINNANRVIYEGDGSVYELLNGILKNIKNISNLDESISEIHKGLNEIVISLEEVSHALREYSRNVVHDPARLERVSARLHELNMMKRKYNTDIAGLITKMSDIEKELNELENIDSEIENVKKRKNELHNAVNDLADKISNERKKAANGLSRKFKQQSEYVGLKDSSFEISFENKKLTADGKDRVSFLFSANPGEPPRELLKVASGGELSRVMLLLKELLTRSEQKSVLIFDEADSGIGGVVAETIGRKIKSLSVNNQVLCITHLPQVAKFADSHFLVNKISGNKKTSVSVERLDDDQRVREIGRMLAGETVTDKTLEVAREMLGRS